MRSIIQRHLFSTLVGPFLVSLLVFTFTFFVYRIFVLTEMVVNKGMDLLQVARVFIYSTPAFFMFTIPMAVLFAVIMAFLKLNGDNEIIALKAAGLSLYRLLPPVLALALIGTGLTLLMSAVLLAKGNLALRNLVYEMTSAKVEHLIRERIFIDDFEGLVIYSRTVDPLTGELGRVFVHNDREEKTDQAIMAERGRVLHRSEQGEVVLRLYQGAIDQLSRDRSEAQTITFKTYDLVINLRRLGQTRKDSLHRSRMSLSQLRAEMGARSREPGRRYYFARDFHERLAIPFACLAFGLLGLPLALLSPPGLRGRSWGVILGTAAFLGYYLLYGTVRALGEGGRIPAWLGMWLPNLIYGFLAWRLIVRAKNEKGFVFWERVTMLRRRAGGDG